MDFSDKNYDYSYDYAVNKLLRDIEKENEIDMINLNNRLIETVRDVKEQNFILQSIIMENSKVYESLICKYIFCKRVVLIFFVAILSLCAICLR